MRHNDDSKASSQNWQVRAEEETLRPQFEDASETLQVDPRYLSGESWVMRHQREQSYGNCYSQTSPEPRRASNPGDVAPHLDEHHSRSQLCYSDEDKQNSLDATSDEHLGLSTQTNYFADSDDYLLNSPTSGIRSSQFQVDPMLPSNPSLAEFPTTQYDPTDLRNIQQQANCGRSDCPHHGSFPEHEQWKNHQWSGSMKSEVPEHIDPRTIASRSNHHSMPLQSYEGNQYFANNDNWPEVYIKSEESSPPGVPDGGDLPVDDSFDSITESMSTEDSISYWRQSSEPSSQLSHFTGDEYIKVEDEHEEKQQLSTIKLRTSPDAHVEKSSRESTHFDTKSSHAKYHNLAGRSTMKYRPKDDLLIEGKSAGLSYREIRRRYSFTEAESTLRGRFRCLIKAKEERVRKPVWMAKDMRLLRQAVEHYSQMQTRSSKNRSGNTANSIRGRSKVRKDSSNSHRNKRNLECKTMQTRWQQTLPKIPWSKVATYIVEQGGSYHFGNGTCRKKWDEIKDLK